MATIKVAVIDDSRVSRNIIVSELSSRKDFEIKAYDSAESFLADIEELNPQVIVSDYQMPKMDGLLLCKAVRNMESFVEVPFFLTSAYVDDAERRRTLFGGVTDICIKPFKHGELLAKVAKAVQGATSSREYSALVVDDSRNIRSLISKMLQEMEISVLEAESVEDAEEVLAQNHVDIIFLDDVLLGKSGVDWCKEMTAGVDGIDLAIIGISSDEEVAIRFLNAGAHDYIAKPFAKEVFQARVENHIRRINLERKLIQAINKERALNFKKNKLLGMAAHDLRNPICVILEFAKLVEEGLFSTKEEIAEAIAAILNSAEHMKDLLSDILDLSSIESGVVDLKKVEIDVEDLLKERVEFMNYIGKRKEIVGSVIKRVAKELPVRIFADRDKMSQVIDNLLSNAIKYSDPGSSFEVYLDICPEGALVEVVDHGQGIKEEEITKVFEEFAKTSTKATADEKSTGLGLAIVKKLIEANDGKIWLSSKLNVGSTFSFVMPLLIKK